MKQKSRILVPAFAVGRTQQLLYHLDELFCAGAFKPFPIYLDSRMAIEAKARIRTLNGFSAYAGQTELLRWFARLASTHAGPDVRINQAQRAA